MELLAFASHLFAPTCWQHLCERAQRAVPPAPAARSAFHVYRNTYTTQFSYSSRDVPCVPLRNLTYSSRDIPYTRTPLRSLHIYQVYCSHIRGSGYRVRPVATTTVVHAQSPRQVAREPPTTYMERGCQAQMQGRRRTTT